MEKFHNFVATKSETKKNQFWVNALVLRQKNTYHHIFFNGGKRQLCRSKLRLKFPFQNMRYGSE
jgi:hypothetical protein